MKQYGAFDAKTHFSELLNAVLHGESCIITKHGVKIALLSPYNDNEVDTPADEAIRAIKNLRKGLSLGKKLSIKALREEGRR